MKDCSVRFDDSSPQTFVVSGICESLEDESRLWYSKKDLESFREENNLRLFNRKHQYVRLHVQGILLQQLEHKAIGIVDPKGLQQLSMACSRSARQRAREQALLNSLEVQQKDLQRRMDLSYTKRRKIILSKTTPI